MDLIKFFCICLFLISLNEVKSQTVEKLELHTIPVINSLNDSLVNPELIPDPKKQLNQVEEETSLKFDTSYYNSQISALLKSWKTKNHIQDDGKVGFRYGLVLTNDNKFCTKKLPVTIHYAFSEIGGGYEVNRVVTAEENIKEIICLFKDVELPDNYAVEMKSIKPQKARIDQTSLLQPENVLEKNVRYSISFPKDSYDIEYTAALAQKGFSYHLNATNNATYFNVELRLKNKKNGSSQIILKSPSDNEFKLQEIMLGDIDHDQEIDIICTVSSDSYEKRLIYLSSKKTKGSLVKYIGETDVWHIDP